MTNGTVIYGEGYDGAPAEIDPLGGNAGLSTPYIELIEPPPPEYPTLIPYNFDSPMYVNGQRVTATLDGVEVPLSLAWSALQNGSAIPAELERFQHLRGFSFDYVGVGLFRTTIPIDIFTNNSGRVWAQPHGTRAEGWRIFEGGISIFSISWATGSQRQTPQPQTPQQTEKGEQFKPKVDFDKLKESINKCLNEIFGFNGVSVSDITPVTPSSNGSVTFNARNNSSYSIESGVNFTSAQLRSIINKHIKPYTGSPLGFTFGESQYTGYEIPKTITEFGNTISTSFTEVNYVANDEIYSTNSEPLSQLIGTGLATQIHEIGHNLAAKVYTGSELTGVEWGEKFEDCVYKEQKSKAKK